MSWRISIVVALAAIHANQAAAAPCDAAAAALLEVPKEADVFKASGGPDGAKAHQLVSKSIKAEFSSAVGRATAENVARNLDAVAAALRAQLPTDPNKKPDPDVVGALSLVTERAATLHARAKLEGTQITVNDATTVELRLANPPTTRLRVSLDRLDGGHSELEWDPAVSTPLLQQTHLDKGTWTVSVSVDPIVIQQGEGSMVIATSFQPLVAQDGALVTVGTQAALVANTTFADSAKQIAMTGWPSPTVSFRCDATRPEIANITFSNHLSTRSAAAQRSAIAPEIVTQTLSILAEIAVERAKSGAMDILKERFIDPLCTGAKRVTLATLHLTSSDDLAFPRTCKLLESLRIEDVLSGGDGLLRALRDDARFALGPAAIMRMTEHEPFLRRLLLAVYDVVNRAIDSNSFNGFDAQLLVAAAGIVDDALPEFALPVSGLKLTLQSGNFPKLQTAVCGTTPLATCVKNFSGTKHSLQGWFAWAQSTAAATDQATLEALIVAYLDHKKSFGAIKAALCAAGMTTLACVQSYEVGLPSKLTLTDLATYVGAHPQLLALLQARVTIPTTVLGTIAPVACQARLAVAIIKKCSGETCTSSMIADMFAKPQSYFAVESTFPMSLCWPDGKTYLPAPEQLSSIERIVVDGLELIDPSQLTNPQDRAVAAINFALEVVKRIRGGEDERVTSVGEIGIALIRSQWDTVLMTTMRLIERLAKDQGVEVPASVEKLAQLAGAVVSYAAVYSSTKGDDPKAARDARKQALGSLIDAATDRKHRDGNWLVTLGSNVGGSWTFANQYNQHDPLESRLGFRVPLGIAIQRLPGPCHLGFHAALNAIDLGQFIRASSDDVRWDSFVAPGAEIGILFGSAPHALSLVAHGAFVPGVGDPDAPTKARWEFGFAIGYFVPFFDFN